MEAIENAAIVSVGRASGFAALAIICIVMSLSYEPIVAARAGCILCLIFAAILFHYAMRAPSRPYRQTELWIILAKEDRPPKPDLSEVWPIHSHFRPDLHGPLSHPPAFPGFPARRLTCTLSEPFG